MKYYLWIICILFLINTTLGMGPTKVVEFEDAYVESQHTKQKIIAVFGASWCGPCVQLKKDLEDHPEIIDDYIYVYIDIDKRIDLKKEYNVRIVPDFMIIESNIEIKRKIGYNSIKELETWLKN